MPTADVGGTSVPDLTGTYQAQGYNDGEYWYQHPSLSYYLYRWTGDHLWYISDTLDTPGANHFFCGVNFTGVYDAVGTYEGWCSVHDDTYCDRLVVAGVPAPNPDVTGTYNLTGLHLTHPYWKHESQNYWIVWSNWFTTWCLYAEYPGEPPTSYFISEDGRENIYNGVGPWTGEIEVQIP